MSGYRGVGALSWFRPAQGRGPPGFRFEPRDRPSVHKVVEGAEVRWRPCTRPKKWPFLPSFLFLTLHTNQAGKCPLSTSTLNPTHNLEIKGFTVADFFFLKPHSLNGIKSASLLNNNNKKVDSFCIRTL